MNINELKKLTLDEIKTKYVKFMNEANLWSENTIKTASSDTFYIWRKNSKDLFWNIILSEDFEKEAKETLCKALRNKQIGSYMTSLRRFREFIEKDNKPKRPCKEEVEYYLKFWEDSEVNVCQENALDKLYKIYPENTDINEIIVKCAALNDFYSTNIKFIYPVAKHIKDLGIDNELTKGNVQLVDKIKTVRIKEKDYKFYSFATKYCSHHKPESFPIYDQFVSKILCYFRDCDGFCKFKNYELKEYAKFKKVVLRFQEYYGLGQYNFKQIDKYLWLLGKKAFN